MVSGEAVVSCRKASPVLETAEEALNKVARSIDGAIERVRNCSRCGRWNDSLDATDFEPVAQAICIISLIGNQAVGRATAASSGMAMLMSATLPAVTRMRHSRYSFIIQPFGPRSKFDLPIHFAVDDLLSR